LRTLSPFRCETPFIGSLYHMLRGSANSTLELTDTLDAENQIRQLDQATWLELRAFSTYGCFNGPTVVLVDSGTMSTAEIFTEAFSHRPRSTILGQPTAGEVVMARWFPVMSLGEDYSLSIPIAGYVTASGAEIEGIGVFPARNLFYDLGKALSGHDSWMDDALLEIRRLSAKK
jgi:C-terminal processing protease CtpA/Prc